MNNSHIYIQLLKCKQKNKNKKSNKQTNKKTKKWCKMDFISEKTSILISFNVGQKLTRFDFFVWLTEMHFLLHWATWGYIFLEYPYLMFPFHKLFGFLYVNEFFACLLFFFRKRTLPYFSKWYYKWCRKHVRVVIVW